MRHSCGVGIVAHPAHPRPLVPHPQLSRLRRESRPARPRRHPRHTRGKALATATPRTGLTPDHAPPVNGHPRILHWLPPIGPDPDRASAVCRSRPAQVLVLPAFLAAPIPCEWAPGPWAGVAGRKRRPEGPPAIDAVTASWTIACREEDGSTRPLVCVARSRSDRRALRRVARRAPGGPPKAEPGASAGPAAARSGAALI